jgi:outer membrane protein assembly factor BamA
MIGHWDYTWHRYSFQRVQLAAEHYIPFWNQKRVIALRAKTDLSYVSTINQVPFYLQPTLGGPDDLRGFQRWRYYDNNASVANLEYRWEVSSMLDMAVFADAGNVFARPGLIGFRGIKKDIGLGFRLKTRDAVFMRLDAGVSKEGVQVWFVFSNIF